jgi:excisionase family DNA binding protein
MQEEKEYLTVDEAADLISVTRATVYNYMSDLNIKTQKFGRNRQRYLSREQVKVIKDYKENPWKYKPSGSVGGPIDGDVPEAA